MQAFLHKDLTVFCRKAPPEFTQQQRDVFCVFSGEGVSRLRDYFNIHYSAIHEGTMFDDSDDEVDEEEGHVTGLMNATAINDDDAQMVNGGINTGQGLLPQ